MSWLDRLKHSSSSEAAASKKGGFVGLVAYPPGASPETERPESAPKGSSVGFVAYPADEYLAKPPTGPAPATTTAQAWRQADAAYLRHHFTCTTCCAAGHGRADRCTTGADLWATYETCP